MSKKKFFIIVGLLFVARVAIAGVLYVTFPVPMTTYGAMGLNFLKSLFAPAGTLARETNPAYEAPVAAVPSPPLADAAWPNAAGRRLAELQQDSDLATVLADWGLLGFPRESADELQRRAWAISARTGRHQHHHAGVPGKDRGPDGDHSH